MCSKILILFITCYSLINSLPNPNLDDIAQRLSVSHYDCVEMTENKLYALNQVRPCHVSPENIEINPAIITVYTKHFRTELNATMCRLKHSRFKWHCGYHDHASIDAEQSTITSDIDLSPEQCRRAREEGKIQILDHMVQFKKGNKLTQSYTNGKKSEENRNHCTGRSWMIKDTFESHIQDVTLPVKLRDGTVHNVNGNPLPCKLDDLGCQSTSLDPYAYIWDHPDNCVLSVLKEEHVNMIKNEHRYHMVSTNDSSSKFLFEVKNYPQKFCNKPNDVYPTNYESMYIVIHTGGFDMASGRKMGITRGSYTLQYSTDNSGKPGLYVYNRDATVKDKYVNTWLNMDYEMLVGTKLDYLFFESTRALQSSEFQMLKNQCEQERTQILTILMLSLENPRLAGYMLTGNRSMFLETDGSLAWLYSCPLISSPLHVMNNCYDKIPIFYKGQFQFVDPITRQTYPNANTQNCTDRIKNLFQLDMQDKDSWFSLNPEPTHRDRPAIFGPKEISPFTKDAFDESQDAGMYTKGQLSDFLDNILISAASRNALQKFSRELIIPSATDKGPDEFGYFAPRTNFYVDNMISPGYFKEQFISTFGIIEYWFSKLGQWFGGFLLIKFLVNVIVITFRSFELHRVTGASWGIGKKLLSATYNLFTVSMISTLNQVPQHDPMVSDTPPDKNYNEHETLEHIYPAISRPPTSNTHTVSPV